jgi:hypothetical protein
MQNMQQNMLNYMQNSDKSIFCIFNIYMQNMLPVQNNMQNIEYDNKYAK